MLHDGSLPNRAERASHNDNHDENKKKNDDTSAETDNTGKEDNTTNAPRRAMPIRLTTPRRRKTNTMEQREQSQ